MLTFDEFDEQIRQEMIVTEMPEDMTDAIGVRLRNISIKIILEVLRRYHQAFQEPH